MLFSLIALGSIWFWTLILLAIVIGLISLEQESVSGLSWTTIIVLALIFFLSPIKDCAPIIVAHPAITIIYVLGYIVLGALWSIFKWDRFIDGIKKCYEETKSRWLKNNHHESITPETKTEWTTYLKSNAYSSSDNDKEKRVYLFATNKISYLEYKSLIVAWMAWWPLSLVWWIIDDPMKRIAEWFVYRFRAIYNWVINRHRSSIIDEVETNENPVVREVKSKHN